MKRSLAVLAAAWGFAEAVLFFVVADVPITLIAARKGLRAGAVAALWATVGALAGGALLYLWAAADPAGVAYVLDFVPAVSAAQVAAVRRAVGDDWAWATLAGGFSGTPYKLYAAAAGAEGIALIPFLAVSLVARLSRFLMSAVFAWALTAILKVRERAHLSLPLCVAWWVLFYAWYWTEMPW